MKTAQNVARVSAQMIRNAVVELRLSFVARDIERGIAIRKNACNSLDAIATELDEYAGAFEPEAKTTA